MAGGASAARRTVARPACRPRAGGAGETRFQLAAQLARARLLLREVRDGSDWCNRSAFGLATVDTHALQGWCAAAAAADGAQQQRSGVSLLLPAVAAAMASEAEDGTAGEGGSSGWASVMVPRRAPSPVYSPACVQSRVRGATGLPNLAKRERA